MRHVNGVVGLLLISCLVISLQVKADDGIMKPVNVDVNTTVVDAAGNTYVGRFCQGSGGDLNYAVTKYDQRSDPVWIVRYNDPSGNIEFEAAIEVDENQSVFLKLRDKKTREDLAAVKYDRYGRMLWVKRTGKAVSSYSSGIEEDFNLFTDDRQWPYLEGWPYIVTMGAFTTSQSIVGANFNPDDTEEELALCLCEGVYAWNHDGTVMNDWPVTQDYNYRGASICVQDGTGKLSCSSNESNGYVHVFRHDGMEDIGWPIITGGNISRGSMRADIDENAVLDILHGGGYPKLCRLCLGFRCFSPSRLAVGIDSECYWYCRWRRE